MNFLAHLHLAMLANSSLTGNLMADFVRGDPHAQWPSDIAGGIVLHRRLDALTDRLPEVRQACALFRAETRRVAPITLDVVWDHFLAKHWTQLHPDESLRQFSAGAERQIMLLLPGTPVAFQELNQIMWRERWLERYAEQTWMQNVLNGMARRRPRLHKLRDSYSDFVEHYQRLEQFFFVFYPRLMALASQQKL